MHARPILGAAAGLTLIFFGISPEALNTEHVRATAAPARIAAPSLGDKDLTDAMTALDAALAAPQEPGRWLSNARTSVWNFTRAVQTHALTKLQETTIVRHLDGLARKYPDGATSLVQARRIVTEFTVGK